MKGIGRDKVVILLSIYNGSKYLEQQLNSVLSQSYKDFTLIIRDDQSTDDSIDIVRNYAINDDRIKLIESKLNLGASKSFLTLVQETEADYYFFCDQDDVWHEDKVRNTLLMFEKNGVPQLVHSDLQIVNENLSIICDSFYKYQSLDLGKASRKKNIIVQNYVVGCSSCINRELVDAANLQSYDHSKVAMHDWWFALVATFFGTVKHMNEATLMYRQHSSNVLGAPDNSVQRYIMSFISGKGLGRVEKFRLLVYKQLELFLHVFHSDLDKRDDELICKAMKIGPSSGLLSMLRMILIDKIRLQGLKRNAALVYSSLRLRK